MLTAPQQFGTLFPLFSSLEFKINNHHLFSRAIPVFFLSFFLSSAFVVPASQNFIPTKTKKIALTFDDGPRPASTKRLQAVLRNHMTPATFFVVGKVAEKYPDMVKSLFQEGHEIANHSWSHPNIHALSPKQIKRELDRTRDLIFEITGVDTKLFRTPGSTKNYLRKRFQVPEGYDLVMWDVHSLDHKGISSKQMVQYISSSVQDGDIILLHNGLRNTVEAVDCLIPLLENRGFEFVTVSDLLKNKEYGPRLVNSATLVRG